MSNGWRAEGRGKEAEGRMREEGGKRAEGRSETKKTVKAEGCKQEGESMTNEVEGGKLARGE
jgi:hypothetical protein